MCGGWLKTPGVEIREQTRAEISPFMHSMELEEEGRPPGNTCDPGNPGVCHAWAIYTHI
jgi:hypothetical protein